MRQITIFIVGVVFAWTASAGAQVPSSRPQQAADTPAPPAADITDAKPMQARIIKLSGRVQYALTDEAGVPGKWQPAKVGDLLGAGTRIRTRLRSKVVLAFGDDSVVLIDRATLASIDQFHRSGDTKYVKLGLGHGAVRAGVAEATLRSDMTIETPIATLSKKGTIDFGIEYEPSTGRYRIFLARRGLVDAMNKITRQSQMVRPGQYVTQAMIRWVETAVFDRHVTMADVFGTPGSEKLFNALNSSGLGLVEPGGGQGICNIGGRQAGTGLPGQQWTNGNLNVLPSFLGPQVIFRPEGNFGTGNGLVPRLFDNRR